MKLHQCTIGALVINHSNQLGHITGFEINSTGETIPVVQLATPYRPFGYPRADNPPSPCHHNNLELFTADSRVTPVP